MSSHELMKRTRMKRRARLQNPSRRSKRLNRGSNSIVSSFRSISKDHYWLGWGSSIFEFGCLWIMMGSHISSRKGTSGLLGETTLLMRIILMIKRFIWRITLYRRVLKITANSKTATKSHLISFKNTWKTALTSEKSASQTWNIRSNRVWLQCDAH